MGAASVSMAKDGIIYKQILIDDVEIAASSGTTSNAVNLQHAKPDGYVAIQYVIEGSGTAKIEWLGSIDLTTYLEPSDASDIVTGITATSGPQNDGNDIEQIDFAGMIVPSMKITVTETGGVSGVTVSVWICYQ